MSDLISRSKIYNYIKTKINPFGKPFEGDVYEFGVKLMEYIEQMDTEEYVTDTNVGSKWIACSERLPENNGNYMTCDEEGNIHIFWYDDCQKYPFNISEYHTRYYPVIAWQPLPEPYKEE